MQRHQVQQIYRSSVQRIHALNVIDAARTLVHSVRCRVYVTVGCPSVCLSHRSTAATAVGGFAAERTVDRRYRPTAAGAVLRAPCTRRRLSAANVDSVMLRADGGGSTQTRFEVIGLEQSAVDYRRRTSQGCRGDGISIPIPIPYPQKILWVSPTGSPYPQNPKIIHTHTRILSFHYKRFILICCLSH